jgi:hypothetical protein
VTKLESFRYAALSYCWGTTEDAATQLKTESSTLEDRYSGIPIETMTTTMVDAVNVAHALEIRYLWIDSLCIIQDDVQDWKNEFSQMGMTFRHAYVTFCPLASSSSHQSFLKRSSSLGVHFKSSVQPKVSGIYSLRITRSYDLELPQEYQSLRNDLKASRWSKRGWTLQEECLSRRILSFGSSRIHFDCGKSHWSESQSVIHSKNYYRVKPELLDVLDSFQRGVIGLETLYKNWRYIAADYNNRQLTYPTDKLPAIAGLARYISEVSGDSYEAGMWRQDMISELMWLSPSHHKNIPLKDWIETLAHPVPYIAPSWSWASNNDYMEFREHLATRLKLECKIEQVSVERDEQHPFGQVRGGKLTVSSKILLLGAEFRISKHSLDDHPSSFALQSVDGSTVAIVRPDWTFDHKEAALQHLMLLLLYSVEEGLDDTESLDAEDGNDERDDEEMENFSEEAGDNDPTSPPDDERKDVHHNDSDEEDLDSENSDQFVDSDLAFARKPPAEDSTDGLILYPADAGQFYRVGMFYDGRGILNDAFRACEARTISII